MSGVVFNDNSGNVRKLLEKALGNAAEVIGGMAESHAKEYCPVDTGNLRNSITHDHKESGDKATVYVGTNVEYAPYVELGTYKMDAQPYLRPGIEDHRAEYQEAFETIMKNA